MVITLQNGMQVNCIGNGCIMDGRRRSPSYAAQGNVTVIAGSLTIKSGVSHWSWESLSIDGISGWENCVVI